MILLLRLGKILAAIQMDARSVHIRENRSHFVAETIEWARNAQWVRNEQMAAETIA